MMSTNITAVVMVVCAISAGISGYLQGRISTAKDCAVAGYFVVDGTTYICKERGPWISVDSAEISDLLKRSAK